MKSQKSLKKKTYRKKLLKKNLSTTKLYDELISLGAFNGDYYKFTHFSQTCFLRGLRNNYTYYKTIDPPTHSLQTSPLTSCYNLGVSCGCILDPHISLSSHLLLGISRVVYM